MRGCCLVWSQVCSRSPRDRVSHVPASTSQSPRLLFLSSLCSASKPDMSPSPFCFSSLCARLHASLWYLHGWPQLCLTEELILLADDSERPEFRPPASRFHTAAVVPYCPLALGQQEGSLYSVQWLEGLAWVTVQCGGIHCEFPGAYMSASTGWSVPLCAKAK